MSRARDGRRRVDARAASRAVAVASRARARATVAATRRDGAMNEDPPATSSSTSSSPGTGRSARRARGTSASVDRTCASAVLDSERLTERER